MYLGQQFSTFAGITSKGSEKLTKKRRPISGSFIFTIQMYTTQLSPKPVIQMLGEYLLFKYCTAVQVSPYRNNYIFLI